MTEEQAPKRRGRPPKSATVVREEKRPRMRAKPNWEDFNPSDDDTPDRLRIAPELIPPDMALQWVTVSVYGQPVPQHRQKFESNGWTPVHQDDFDGQFDGMFMRRGDYSQEINVDGLVLMARPKEMNDKARKVDQRAAREQLSIKEQALRGGDLPVSLDAQHPTAVRSNRISKSFERIEVPKD